MSFVTFGTVLHGLKSTPSTQDDARRIVESEGVSATGTVYLTSDQTAGRGRQGKAWHAPPGANLSQTMIGAPVPLTELWHLSFVAGVAVQDALHEVAPEIAPRLRFPNDVQIGGKKVAGILVEMATGPGVPSGTAMPLIGIGVNVCGPTDALPPEVAVRATTLEAATGRLIHTGIVGGYLNRALSIRWREWRAENGFESIVAAWRERQDTEARRLFILDGESVSCRVLDITVDGLALLELPDSSRRSQPIPQIILG